MLDQMKLEQLYVNEKMTYQQISELLDCSIGTVHRYVMLYGIRKHKLHVTKEQLSLEYIEHNRTANDIAKQFGCSLSSVKNKIRRLGLTRHPSKSRPAKETKPKRQRPGPDLLDKPFGQLTVVERITPNMWRCRCSCGQHIVAYSSQLKKKVYVSCGCTRLARGSKHQCWRGYGELSQKKYGIIKRGAHKHHNRKLEFSVSAEYLWNLFVSQDKKCALTKTPLSINQEASLDRIDSSKGYIEGNVQWVHKDINTMKWAFPQNTFIEWCRLVTQNAT